MLALFFLRSLLTLFPCVRLPVVVCCVCAACRFFFPHYSLCSLSLPVWTGTGPTRPLVVEQRCEIRTITYANLILPKLPMVDHRSTASHGHACVGENNNLSSILTFLGPSSGPPQYSRYCRVNLPPLLPCHPFFCPLPVPSTHCICPIALRVHVCLLAKT